MFKNVASQKVAVYAWDNAAGSEKTGDAANITAQISIDGGATAATDDTNPTELDAADAPGIYIFDMTQAETNGDLIVISPTSSTGDVVLRPAIIYTQAPADACLFTGGTVWVDPTGTNSTDLPYGSAPYPTSTIANGKTIADALNIQRINITGVISLVAAMEHYELIGSGNIDVTDIVNINSQSIEHSTLRDLTVTGIGGNAATIADQTRYSNCLIYAHTNINGVVQGGSLGGACSIRDTGYALFTDVFFGQGAPCTLTVQAPTVCNIINMRGTLTISGMDGGVLNITLTDGSFVIIDNTCTAGTITLTGIGTVTDNSGGGCTVIKLADTPTVLTEATNALIATMQADVDDILIDTGTTLDGKIDTIDSNVDEILVDTGTTLDGKIDTVDGNVFNLVTALITAFAPSSLAADLGVIYGSVDDIVNDLTLISGPGFDMDNDSLSILSDKLDALVADVLAGVVEGTYTVQDCMKILLAYMASKASGGGTTEVRFRDTADTKDRITMTVDRNGNRSAIDVDVT